MKRKRILPGIIFLTLSAVMALALAHEQLHRGKLVLEAGVVNASDLRYKRDIRTIGGALSKVLSLRGVTIDWRREEFLALDFAAGRSVGFVAQEVERVVPEAPTRDAAGFRSVAYSHLTPVLVEAVKGAAGTDRDAAADHH